MGWGLREAPVAPVFVMKEQLRQELPPAATFQHFYLPGKWIFYMHRRRSRTSGPTNVFFNFITLIFIFFPLFPHLANGYLAHKAMMMIQEAVSWKRKTGFILQEGHQTPTALSS